MCGICGIVNKKAEQPVDMTILQRMTDIINHRGPDGEGFYSGPGVGLGFRRLSIIDLETGDQPLSNETGSLKLICNGEIYNHVELRKLLIQKSICSTPFSGLLPSYRNPCAVWRLRKPAY